MAIIIFVFKCVSNNVTLFAFWVELRHYGGNSKPRFLNESRFTFFIQDVKKYLFNQIAHRLQKWYNLLSSVYCTKNMWSINCTFEHLKVFQALIYLLEAISYIFFFSAKIKQKQINCHFQKRFITVLLFIKTIKQTLLQLLSKQNKKDWDTLKLNCLIVRPIYKLLFKDVIFLCHLYVVTFVSAGHFFSLISLTEFVA
jgi:hypothetical protein